MSYKTLYEELRGMVPKLHLPLAKSFINRAWADVRRSNLWSFQLYEDAQWIVPAVINTGTVSVTLGSATVTPNAAALAAITAGVASYSTIPQRQFRVAGGTIYNITAYTGATLTLDRVYSEATSAAAAYQIFQCYYAAPYIDHLSFITVRNIPTYSRLDLNHDRQYLDGIDPQRSYYGSPARYVVPYKVDPVTTSTTYKYLLHELWPIPLAFTQFQLYGIRRGVDLTNPIDELPSQIGDDLIIARAKRYAYMWAESQKDTMSKGGPDYKFLVGETEDDYLTLLKSYRKDDMERVYSWVSERGLSIRDVAVPYYDTESGRASPGW